MRKIWKNYIREEKWSSYKALSCFDVLDAISNILLGDPLYDSTNVSTLANTLTQGNYDFHI